MIFRRIKWVVLYMWNRRGLPQCLSINNYYLLQSHGYEKLEDNPKKSYFFKKTFGRIKKIKKSNLSVISSLCVLGQAINLYFSLYSEVLLYLLMVMKLKWDKHFSYILCFQGFNNTLLWKERWVSWVNMVGLVLHQHCIWEELLSGSSKDSFNLSLLQKPPLPIICPPYSAKQGGVILSVCLT